MSSIGLSKKIQGGFKELTSRPNQDIGGIKRVFLRKWQEECFRLWNSKQPEVFGLIASTGAGKSFAIKSIVWEYLCKDPKNKAIIAVPQIIIGSSFAPDDSIEISLPNKNLVSWSIPSEYYLIDGNGNESKKESLSQFMSPKRFNKNPASRIIVTTQQTLAQSKELFSKSDLSRTMLVIDEAHHLQMNDDKYEEYSNEIGKIAKEVYDQDGSLLLTTATFFRGDRLPVIPQEIMEDAVRFELPIDKYMNSLSHLKEFVYNFSFYKEKDEFDELKKEIENTLHKKTIIYMPSVNSYYNNYKDLEAEGSKKKYIELMTSAIMSAYGVDELKVYESDTEKYSYFMCGGKKVIISDMITDGTHRDKTRLFITNNQKSASGPDYILALETFKEGANYEPLENVIILGHRKSLKDIIQIIGRALRDFENKPTVKITEIMPFFNEQDEEEFKEKANDFIKAFVCCMLFIDIISPNINFHKKDNGKDEKEILVDGNDDEEESISEILSNKYGLQSNEIIDLVQEVIIMSDGDKEQAKEIIKEIFDDKNIKIEDDEAERLINAHTSFVKKSIPNLLDKAGLSIDEIDIDLIDFSQAIGLLRRITSKSLGLDIFQKVRETQEWWKNEERFKENVIELFKWIKNNNDELPSKNSNDPIEKKIGQRLSGLKQAKQGKGGCFWDQGIIEELCKQYGVPANIFDVKIFKENVIELFKWIKNNNDELPRENSNDPIEKKMGQRLSGLKKAKQGKGRGFWHQGIIEELCEQYGVSATIFDVEDNKETFKENVAELFKWIKTNNDELPSQKSNDLVEKKMGQRLSKLKQAKQGKGGGFWHQGIIEELCKQYGVPANIFDVKDNEERFKENVIELLERIKNNNNKLPKERSNDPIEKKMGIRLNNLKNAKQGKGRGFWHQDIIEELCEQYDISATIFDVEDNKETFRGSVIELFKWIKNNNDELPREKSNDLVEKKMGQRLSKLKQAKQGKVGYFWHQGIIEELCEQYDISATIFDVKDNEEIFKENVIELFKWIKTNNKLPSQKSNDPIEKKMGQRLSNLKRAKQGKVGYFWDQGIIEELCKQYGISVTIFETRKANAESK